MCSSQVAGCAQICYVWTIYIINNHLLPKRRLIILCVHSKSVKSRVLSRRSKAQRTKRRMKNEEQTTRKPGVISSVNQIIIVPLLSPTFTVFNTNGAVSGRPAVELEASFLGGPAAAAVWLNHHYLRLCTKQQCSPGLKLVLDPKEKPDLNHQQP